MMQSSVLAGTDVTYSPQLVDFFRFGASQVEQLYAQQPSENSAGTWNRVEYRPLEGFVFAVTPFKYVGCRCVPVRQLFDAPRAASPLSVPTSSAPRPLPATFSSGSRLPARPTPRGSSSISCSRRASRRTSFSSFPARTATRPSRSSTRSSRTACSPVSTSPARPTSSGRSGSRSATTSTAT